MKRIWAPWRMKYITGDKPHNCVLCEALQAGDDAARYILYRSKKAALMLNLYPYINGHLMVVPYAHVGDLVELDEETLADMMLLTKKGVQALREAMNNPHGFNVGMNLGRVAGAGIQDHVHIHIVPRWEGDTNFMPVLADVRIIPESLDDTYHKVLTALSKAKEEHSTHP
ncbi:MAG: HIT domain-containing protein [Candidatus Hadarchaeum sp.]